MYDYHSCCDCSHAIVPKQELTWPSEIVAVCRLHKWSEYKNGRRRVSIMLSRPSRMTAEKYGCEDFDTMESDVDDFDTTDGGVDE